MNVGDLVSLAAGVGLALVFGLAAARALGVRGVAATLLATWVLGAASIVGPAEALSLVDRLTLWPWLGLQALLTAGAVACAWRTGHRPRRVALRPELRRLREAGRAHPAIAFLAVVAGLAMLVQALTAVLVAPNNWDAMMYHLSKAAYWLQYDSATQYVGGSWHQLYSPPNAELLQAWTMELFGSDRFTQLVQWSAGVACGLAVYEGAREVGARRAHAVFAAALFVVLPQPLLQSSSAQNDLVTAAFVGAAALFVVRGLRSEDRGALVVGAVAAGLASGTKGSAFVVAPGIALIVLVVLVRCRPSRRTVATGLIAMVASVALLGAFNWVLSYRNTGSPAPEVASDAAVKPGSGGAAGRSGVDAIAGNAGHILWRFADLPGMQVTVLDRALAAPLSKTFGERYPNGDLPIAINTTIDEDRVGFGAVGFALLFPVILLAAFGRRSDPRRRLLAIGSLVGLSMYLLFIAANPFMLRVLLPWLVVTAPLLAVLAVRPGWRTVAIVLALASLLPSVLVHRFRPLVPETGEMAWKQSRAEQIDLSRWPSGSAAVRLDQLIGPTAPIGFVGNDGSKEYPYFGTRPRRFIRRYTGERVTPERIARDRLAGIVFADVGPPPPEFEATPLAEGHWLARPR